MGKLTGSASGMCSSGTIGGRGAGGGAGMGGGVIIRGTAGDWGGVGPGSEKVSMMDEPGVLSELLEASSELLRGLTLSLSELSSLSELMTRTGGGGWDRARLDGLSSLGDSEALGGKVAGKGIGMNGGLLGGTTCPSAGAGLTGVAHTSNTGPFDCSVGDTGVS